MSSIRPFLICCLAVLAACLAMEGMLRLSGSYGHATMVNDPVSGLLHFQPETIYHEESTCYDVSDQINSIGLHGPEIAKDKAPGTYRIMIVGSSFAEALQVPLEKRFDTELSAMLNASSSQRYEVVSLGFSGNGTYLDMLYYKNYVAQFHPDLVIDLMTDYDLGKDVDSALTAPRFSASGETILELPAMRRSGFMLSLKDTLRHSALIEMLYERYVVLSTSVKEMLHPKIATQEGAATSTPDYTATWETEGRLFHDFKRLVESGGAKFAIVSWTTKDIKDRSLMADGLSVIAREEDIPYDDLTPALGKEEARTGMSPVFTCDGHWNETGHRWTAEALAAYLTSSHLIP